MRLKDLHELPKLRDSLGYLYVEHARIDRHNRAIAIHDQRGRTPVPCAGLTLLMLGPGTRITHAAVETLADNGCLVAWCGEAGVRFYAAGMGETRKADLDLRQIRGMEGARVRDAYARASRETGVPWEGRSYRRDDWRSADPVNRS